MPEFDAYARDYRRLKESSLKRFLGVRDEDLLRQKVRLVARLLRPQGNVRLLDYGCGGGELLEALGLELGLARAVGVDVSPAMLDEARFQSKLPPGSYAIDTDLNWERERGSFDAVILSSVLHHIPQREWPELLSRLSLLLDTRGVLIVIEHNPQNPITRLVVRRTPIDMNAQLLKPSTLQASAHTAGVKFDDLAYFLAVPLNFPFAQTIDRFLRNFPFGGQWVSIGTRGGSSKQIDFP